MDLWTLTGGVGAAIVIVAYFLNQHGRLPSEDWRYPAINLLGAVLILVSLSHDWNLPAVVIEGFWIAISLWSLARHRRTRRS